MSNKPCPWSLEEVAALTEGAQFGLNDVQIAEKVALAYTSKTRRTPHACRDKARALGLDIVWTTRPTTLTPGHRAQFGYEDENPHVKAEREDGRFKRAMERAGYTPQEPSRNHGTHNPQTISASCEGRPSSAAGWLVE